MYKRQDVDGYDKKQYQKTGDGHIMAIDAGAKMDYLGHTKMMHDFDYGLMYEEPFLYVNMEGKRFCNEDTGFVYMANITKYLPRYNGANVDANHPDGSLGWYCQLYDLSLIHIFAEQVQSFGQFHETIPLKSSCFQHEPC